MTLSATPSAVEQLGYFRLFARPPGGRRREITIFRGAPIVMQNCVLSDPFTHTTAALVCNQVTPWDNPGSGDLDWLVPDSDIDIVWQNTGSHSYEWRWEGYIASYNFAVNETDTSFQIDLKGALYGLDDYLAIPGFPKRPIPYEILISRAFDQSVHPTRLGQFRVLWPAWWETVVPEFNDPNYLTFLKPWGVATGQRWTGFTSRSTGSWEPLLTGHVQSLLSVMFAEGGAQWSIRNRGYRRPELYLRQIPDDDSQEIIEITVGAPGVTMTGSRDYTQRATVIYGQGVDDAGISYAGMQVSPDGKTTTYRPFAYQPTTWPRLNNPNLDNRVKTKETMIRFQDGVDQVSAEKIALGQLQRFSEPGITGSITLKSDVRLATGELLPRLLIKAGATVRLRGLFGLPEGVLVHLTQVTVDFNNLTVTADFDSKYRDQLTVEEVKARTRDALNPLRALQVGKYANTVQDLVLPWSYTEGSGCVPEQSKDFFNEKIPSTATFPYEEWTTQFPPKDPDSRPYYIRINPTHTTDANKNWAGVPRDGQAVLSIPIRMSQAGAIRLTQIAAYDKDGHVLPVRFHFSVYKGEGTSYKDMPKFPYDPEAGDPTHDPPLPPIQFLKPQGITVNYQAFGSNPFFRDAWETVREDGTSFQSDAYVVSEGADLVVGWGNYFEPAGYSPGRFSRGAARTGLLEDATNWQWDLSDRLDLQSGANNALEEYAGMLFVQIYCDEQGAQPVYFMGRFFRSDPGTS